ncbi:MAG: Rieske (2Fe-2S) protein [Deltaproteobacteria bacterium]
MAEFVKIANLSEVAPGTAKAVDVNGQLIALFNVDGAIFALDNTCLHQGGPLGEGLLEGDVITCPWHMWEYNVRTGEKVGHPELKVNRYEIQVANGEIKVAV